MELLPQITITRITKDGLFFFLDEFESSNLPAWSQVLGVNSLSHLRTLIPIMNFSPDNLTMFPNLGIELEIQYWFGLSHVGIPDRSLFPIFLKFPSEVQSF